METIFENNENEHHLIILTPQEKLYIKKYLEKKLDDRFNSDIVVDEFPQENDRMNRMTCMTLCCLLPFTIILSPCLCYFYSENVKQKKERQQKIIEDRIKYLQLIKTKKYQIEFIEKEIKHYEKLIFKMNKQTSNFVYKIELLEEKLKYFKEDK